MRTIKYRAFILGKMYDVKSLDFNDEDGITITTSGGFYNIGHGTKDEHGHLMQYTGLKDKNGVEICEGDIVQYTESYGRKDEENVVFEEEVKIYPSYTYPFSNVQEVDDCWYSVEHSEYEIIGNIHEGEKNE